jgi:TolB-like protein
VTPGELDRDGRSRCATRTLEAAQKVSGPFLLALEFVVADNYLVGDPETAGVAGGDSRSIAALAFANASADAENAAFFADGIHDELLSQLAKIGSLKVISRTSVEEYRVSPKNICQIGRELGAATLLEGRVQRDGVFARAKTIAATGQDVWDKTFLGWVAAICE